MIELSDVNVAGSMLTDCQCQVQVRSKIDRSDTLGGFIFNSSTMRDGKTSDNVLNCGWVITTPYFVGNNVSLLLPGMNILTWTFFTPRYSEQVRNISSPKLMRVSPLVFMMICREVNSRVVKYSLLRLHTK